MKRTVESYLEEVDDYAQFGTLFIDYETAEIGMGFCIEVVVRFVFINDYELRRTRTTTGPDKKELIEDATQTALKRLLPQLRGFKKKLNAVSNMFETGRMMRMLK